MPPPQPLKPIYKHPHNQTNTKHLLSLKPPLTPSPPPKTKQGDPTWLRIMQTKENQWRLINTIALHQLNLLERSACKQLDSLAEKLDLLITQTAALDSLVSKCRSIRARQHFLTIASPPLTQAIRTLSQLHYHLSAQSILNNRSALPLNAPNVETELAKFRNAARQFANTAEECNLKHVAQLASQLQLLAQVSNNEPPAVSCAAQAVLDAAIASEKARLRIVDAVTDNHDPSFDAPTHLLLPHSPQLD